MSERCDFFDLAVGCGRKRGISSRPGTGTDLAAMARKADEARLEQGRRTPVGAPASMQLTMILKLEVLKSGGVGFGGDAVALLLEEVEQVVEPGVGLGGRLAAG